MVEAKYSPSLDSSVRSFDTSLFPTSPRIPSSSGVDIINVYGRTRDNTPVHELVVVGDDFRSDPFPASDWLGTEGNPAERAKLLERLRTTARSRDHQAYLATLTDEQYEEYMRKEQEEKKKLLDSK